MILRQFDRQMKKTDITTLPHTKINSEWAAYLNIRANTLNLLEKDIGVGFYDPGLVHGFSDMTPKAQATRFVK